MTSLKTRIMDMKEDPKPLALFQIESTQISRFFKIRGGKK
jgi:hypothetical protein